MHAQRSRSISLAFLLLLSTASVALAPVVSADDRVLLDLDVDHLVLAPGDAANVTLTLENNDSAIRDFALSLAGASDAWDVSLADENLSQVLPTFSASTTVIVRLAANATQADHGGVVITANASDTGATTAITLHLSVAPVYGPSLDVSDFGEAGVIEMAAGESQDVNLSLSNAGSALDHIVLSVDEQPDLADFWANQQSSNGSNGSSGGSNDNNDTGGEQNNTNGSSGGNNSNGTGNGTNTTTLPELGMMLTGAVGQLTADWTATNLTTNDSYVIDWTVTANGSAVPTDVGSHAWNATGPSHNHSETWNLSAGTWCVSADLRTGIIVHDTVSNCANVTAPGGGGGNGTSMSRAIPTGWDVRFVESTQSNMSAGESRQVSLHISVPAGEAPGSYGFQLFAGSAFGNFSVAETIVVNVTGSHNISMSADDGGHLWLPGENGTVAVTIANVGDHEAESVYSVGETDGCSASIDASDADGARLGPGDEEAFDILVTVDAGAEEGDDCDVTIEAWDEISDDTFSETFTFAVGRADGLELAANLSTTAITPGESENVMVSLRNIGTESVHVRIEAVDDAGQSMTLDTAWESIDAAAVVDFSIGVAWDAATDLVGEQNLTFIAQTEGGETNLSFTLTFDVAPRAAVTMTMPAGGVIDVAAGGESTLDVDVENTGTADLNLTQDWADAPAGLTVSVTDGVDLAAGEATTIQWTFTASDGMASGAHTVALSVLAGGENLASDSVEVRIGQQAASRLLSGQTSKVVDTIVGASYTVTLVNDGNEADTFSIDLAGADGFEVTLSPLSLDLDAGASGEITLDLVRAGSTSDATLTMSATSNFDSDSVTTLELTAGMPTYGVTMTSTGFTGTALPGEVVNGVVHLAAAGDADDAAILSASAGWTCDFPASVAVVAGSASTALEVACTAAADAVAGPAWLNVTAVSSMGAGAVSLSHEANIAPQRTATGDPMLSVTISGDDWTIHWNETATFAVTIHNEGNEQLTGQLSLTGEAKTALNPSWRLVSGGGAQMFALAPGASGTYLVEMTAADGAAAGMRDIAVTASGTTGDGQGFAITSPVTSITVAGTPAPPTTVQLWDGGPEVSNSSLIYTLLAGWALFFALVGALRLRSKLAAKRAIRDAWESESDEEEDDGLGQGEVRANDDSTANCHDCNARIRLPEDKAAPFRFKCPTCESMNRLVE